MNIPIPPVHPPEDQVDRAIAAVLSEPLPQDSLQRTMATALSWETTTASPSSPLRRWSPVSMLAAATVLMLIGMGIVLRFSGPRGEGAPPADLNRSSSNSHSLAFSESDNQRNTFRFYEPVPMISTLVADIAPVLVTNGPPGTLNLGDRVAHKDIGQGLAADQVRLHIWNWSKSDRSQVMVVPKDYRGSALSPDGTMLLATSGKAVELATGKTREFNGFDVEAGQRLSHVWFSPSGRYVAALIHLRSEKDQVQLTPPLYSMRHWWSLRVIELATGKAIDEFPSAGLPVAAFTPDEVSIIFASPENGVTQRDLTARENLMHYQPAFGARAVVGIALSHDGRLVAAGHYDGALFIWETQSGKQALHHQFLRDNGEHDRFFQPRLLRFSADDQFLAMASNNRLKVLELGTEKIVAQHYHETTPAFDHLRWSDDGERVILVTAANVAELAPQRRFPPRATADFLPQVYEWDWRTAVLSPKVYPDAGQ